MIGPLVNGAALFIGSLAGGFIGPRFSRDFRLHMPMVFGCASIGISITLIIKGANLAPVILAVILGTVFGEAIHLESKIQRAATRTKGWIEKLTGPAKDMDHKEFMDKFVALVVLFCFSGMGIYGSLNEGMTGDPTLLIIKSILDLFTSLIFASTMGYTVATLVIPQVFIQAMLFYGATLIVPYTDPAMLNNFSAGGGIVLLAIGLRICGIQNLPVANMIPALFLVMPLTWCWIRFLP
ncbi:MAG: DUF554 domain-containing protein [Desulfopila sp.]